MPAACPRFAVPGRTWPPEQKRSHGDRRAVWDNVADAPNYNSEVIRDFDMRSRTKAASPFCAATWRRKAPFLSPRPQRRA